MFIDLNSNAWYDFKDGLTVTTCGNISVISYHTQKFTNEDLELPIGTKVIAGWSTKRSYPAIITGVQHKFFDCGTTRYTYYMLRRTN